MGIKETNYGEFSPNMGDKRSQSSWVVPSWEPDHCQGTHPKVCPRCRCRTGRGRRGAARKFGGVQDLDRFALSCCISALSPRHRRRRLRDTLPDFGNTARGKLARVRLGIRG